MTCSSPLSLLLHPSHPVRGRTDSGRHTFRVFSVRVLIEAYIHSIDQSRLGAYRSSHHLSWIPLRYPRRLNPPSRKPLYLRQTRLRRNAQGSVIQATDRTSSTQCRFRILIVGRVRHIPVPPARSVHGPFHSPVSGNRPLSTPYSRLPWRYTLFRDHAIVQHLITPFRMSNITKLALPI